MKGLRIVTAVEIDGKFYSSPTTAAQKLAEKLCWNVHIWGKYNRNRSFTVAQKKRAFARVKPIAEKMFASIQTENSTRPAKYRG
jgi:hypothetical protein